MKIYKVEQSGSSTMGFSSYEKFYQHIEDAMKDFDEKIQEYRDSKDRVTKKDLDGKTL